MSSSTTTISTISSSFHDMSIAGPSHRRSRSRELWSSLSDFVNGPKIASEPQQMDEGCHIEKPITLTIPPTLPRCCLSTIFQCSETNNDIPPAFYPGQAIPTIVSLEYGANSFLPHSLNLNLTMSLVGTLHIPDSPPRTIICVSVSLAEGLQIWARDAQQAYATNPPNSRIDATKGLPGGTYTLPLTVQVPSTPRLPPTFTVPNATFAVTYALSVTLTCDDPIRAGVRSVLAEASRPFEMMPETLPTRAPHYKPQSFWVKPDPSACCTNPRWTIQPFLPTTAYSPTSVIPLTVKLTPPNADKCQILVRISLVRREHSSFSAKDFRDPLGQAGLVQEEELLSRHGWIESNSTDVIELSDICLPLSLNQSWDRGFSTMLHVGPNHTTDENISVSSTFHLAISMAFLPAGEQKLSDFFNLPEKNVFTDPSHESPINLSAIKRSFPGTIRTLPLPIVVGSVSEPRSAMHNFSWSDLHLDRSSGQEVGRVVEGAGVSCEDGWILAPPSYTEAVKQAPYDF